MMIGPLGPPTLRRGRDSSGARLRGRGGGPERRGIIRRSQASPSGRRGGAAELPAAPGWAAGKVLAVRRKIGGLSPDALH